MSKLNLKGLQLFKKKNDETYLKQNDTIELSDLKEVTTVDDDDIIIKGQAETNELVRIKASDFFAKVEDEMGELNSALADLHFKMFQNLSAIGLSSSTATSLLAITQTMASKSSYCILFMAVNSADTSSLYSAGVIPVNNAGTLEILYASRARAMFTSDSGATYVCASSNGNTTNFTSWAQL